MTSALTVHARGDLGAGPVAQLIASRVPKYDFTTVVPHTSLPFAPASPGVDAELLDNYSALARSTSFRSSSDNSPSSQPSKPPRPAQLAAPAEPLTEPPEGPHSAAPPPHAGAPPPDLSVTLRRQIYSTGYCDVYLGTMAGGGAAPHPIMVKICDPRHRPGGLEILKEEALLYTTRLVPLQGTTAPHFYGYYTGYHLSVSVIGRTEFRLGVLLHEDVGLSMDVFCTSFADVGPYCEVIRAAFESIHEAQVAGPVPMDVENLFTRLRCPSSLDEWEALGYGDDGDPLPRVDTVAFADFEAAVAPETEGWSFEGSLATEKWCLDGTLRCAAEKHAQQQIGQ